MRVHRVPVDLLQLVHLRRAIGNAGLLVGRQRDGLVDRPEPGALRQHRLHFGRQQELHEFLRLRLVAGPGDRAGRDAQRNPAFLGIDEIHRKAGGSQRLFAARSPYRDDRLVGLEQLGHLARRGFINQHVGIDLLLENREAGIDVFFAAAVDPSGHDQRMQPIRIIERRDHQLLFVFRIFQVFPR